MMMNVESSRERERERERAREREREKIYSEFSYENFGIIPNTISSFMKIHVLEWYLYLRGNFDV